MNLLKGSLFLKTAALALAAMSYFFIRAELARNEQKTAADPSYKLIKLTSKILPVNVRIESEPPADYDLDEDAIKVSPASVVAVGPEALLDGAANVQTAIIDVSESTKTFTRKIPIESVAGIHIAGSLYTVDVTVPIRKIVPDSPAAATAAAEAPQAPTA